MDAKHTGHMSRFMAVFAIGFLLFPLLAVVPVSFTSKRYLSMPEGHWSLRHYAALFSSSDWMSSIVQSVLVAVCASVIATVLAVTFSVGVWYVRSRIATAMVALVLVPMVIPPVISAMVLYFMETKLGSWMPSAGYDTLPGVVIAHIVVITPYCVVTMLVALSPLDRRIELAARNLGAGLAQTTFMVVLPNLKLAIASTFFLGLALSWEEISVTLFVTSVNVNTVPRHIWTDLRDNISPGVAAISVLLLALTTAVLLGRMAVQHLAARRQTTH
ncbi:ABC transporter permease [Verminephrobacter eiseniae]|uniref:ABC transporter permease n=2 Tax=Verminephrobacter eiseniae TaxID=364317 RepID=UPI0010EB4871|nr:ABC transporter permease [Verminephrobacter eiseniae]KAB7604207.1 ABC transporter permease [Verminephrobacter sp. Larva24]MCW5231091.1 ABC transporter permease [Verminephrobacter eiseniae]MCW5292823.1 ABC transporter permease [Verminephrobacter eiseniae]MCW8186189.1 ABC transporter permease [Verminephrobacter eiseniae]MCW8224487.1 ABC transporter permease [Verminephrobacter eiseniae]